MPNDLTTTYYIISIIAGAVTVLGIVIGGLVRILFAIAKNHTENQSRFEKIEKGQLDLSGEILKQNILTQQTLDTHERRFEIVEEWFSQFSGRLIDVLMLMASNAPRRKIDALTKQLREDKANVDQGSARIAAKGFKGGSASGPDDKEASDA